MALYLLIRPWFYVSTQPQSCLHTFMPLGERNVHGNIAIPWVRLLELMYIDVFVLVRGDRDAEEQRERLRVGLMVSQK